MLVKRLHADNMISIPSTGINTIEDIASRFIPFCTVPDSNLPITKCSVNRCIDQSGMDSTQL
ncbi:hypothetical protein WAG12_06240 [Bacillus cereus]|uniref:hypothetical protein n=1 Tax=Bacillus cereus group TaxID=86661 RepID=UPI002DB69F87|nr:hypothetical protein [Bacillus tropicus]MEC1979327.1 hypothetical protein [Bacillus cereus]MEC2922196.1 hypothetical protein [Bacillus tropicus]MEC2925072.1 hypothetical protein [Bacillus tropicus]MEC2957511.1 hypothetical protein [Bacillus tropicus]MEC3052421.1 hypothetical protein [Bacillus tropicus]